MAKPKGQLPTSQLKAAFLEAYAEEGTVTHAARKVGCDRRNHSDWMRGDPEYAKAFEQHAKPQAADSLEKEAMRRAVKGVEEPVFHDGEIVGHKQRYSDTLLIFLLKGALPDKYKDRIEQHSTGSQTIIVEQTIARPVVDDSNEDTARVPTD